jgi:hypothetical protein
VTNETAVIVLGMGLLLVVASMIAAGAGYLARRDGASYPAAGTWAAASFVATLMVASAVTTALAALNSTG